MRALAPIGLLVVLAGPALAAEPGGEPAAEVAASPLRIGVAPFESVAGPDTLVPDLATLLADRLARQQNVEVIGPARLGAPPSLEPDPDQVKRWAARSDLDAVVVGRTTRASGPVSLELRLRAGASGALLESWFREVPNLDEAADAIDQLVPELVADVAAQRDAATAGEDEVAGASFGLSLDRDEPLSIRSDHLEAFQNDGARRLVFSGNVEAEQADVKITAQRLEALYPAGSNKPDRLIATGRVVMAQAERVAHCDVAIYDRAAQQLICTGNAELQDGEDRVAGRQIEFDLETESVTVSGSAVVVFHPREAEEVPN